MPEFFQEKGWICENLRFAAKICVLGSLSLCHLSSVLLSAPRFGVRDFLALVLPWCMPRDVDYAAPLGAQPTLWEQVPPPPPPPINSKAWILTSVRTTIGGSAEALGIRDGPTTATTILSSSRGAPFFIFGAPPDDAPNAPSTQWNTEKP